MHGPGPGRARVRRCSCCFPSSWGAGGELEEEVLEAAVGGAELGEREAGLHRDQPDDRRVGVDGQGTVLGAGGGQAGLVEGSLQGVHVSCADGGPRGLQQFGLGTLRHEPAVPDHHDVVGDDLDLMKKVRRQQDGPATVREVTQQVPHPPDAGRVEPIGRFVEDEHGRASDQGHRDAEALTHPERVAADPAVRIGFGEADQVERLRDTVSG